MDVLYNKNTQIAIIADWLIDFGGAELVISHMLEIFPDADVYTSVLYMDHPMLAGRKVYTSWLQKVPFFSKKHKLAGILRPWAFRSFDLSRYDLVICSSSAESKQVAMGKWREKSPNTKVIVYCHTPIRYYWSHAKEYEDMMEFGIWNPFVRGAFRLIKGWMQRVDLEAVAKVDQFIANSKTTQERIKKYYQRESKVIYPGVAMPDLSFSEGEFLSEKPGEIIATQGGQKKAEYYLGLGRCIPYKKFDLLVDAFNMSEKKLILCTATDTPIFRKLKAISKPNIEWRFRISNEEKHALMQNAKAFLFPPEEDFGLVPVEAMISGTPVIAYGKGGGTESVVDGETGVFFTPQTPDSLNEAIERFEEMTFDREKIKRHANRFGKEKFQKGIEKFISNIV